MSKTTTLAKPTLGSKTTSEAALAFAEAGAAPEKTGAKQAAAERRAFFAPEGYRRLTINLPEALHKKLRLAQHLKKQVENRQRLRFPPPG